MYAELAARAAALAAELPDNYGLPSSSPTPCNAHHYIGGFQDTGAFFDGLPPGHLAAAEPVSSSDMFPGSVPARNSAAAGAYTCSGAFPGSSADFGVEQRLMDPQSPISSPSWCERLGERCSRSHADLEHEAPSRGRSAPGISGVHYCCAHANPILLVTQAAALQHITS